MLAIAQFYLSAIVLMLPLLSCVGIGVFWGKRDLPFGGAFITTRGHVRDHAGVGVLHLRHHPPGRSRAGRRGGRHAAGAAVVRAGLRRAVYAKRYTEMGDTAAGAVLVSTVGSCCWRR